MVVPAGVGSTAVGVARIRAAETARPDRLFDDPLASVFAAFAGPPTRPPSMDRRRLPGIITSVVVRTRFLDEWCLSSGLDQVVLLGAGLDARAFRLAWPAGTRLYELDTAEVLGFKAEALATSHATPTCTRVPI